MSDLVKIELPFSGFYESIHDSEIDRAIEDGFNYDLEKQKEVPVPDDIWAADINYKAIEREYCEAFVNAFADRFGLTLTFDEMRSPREYNFSTDRLFCKIPRDEINTIRKKVEAHPDYQKLIKERFTSRDGFWSFYSSDYKNEEWTRETLDECQYEVIIRFWLDNISDDVGSEGWRMEEYYLTNDFEMSNWDSVIEAHRAIEEHLTSVKVDSAIDSIEKAIEWMDDEYRGEHNMPTFAYEAVQDMKQAVKALKEAKNEIHNS